MLQLYHYPSTAAMVPHILLEEIGVPFERVHVDRQMDAHRQPDYLRINPNGLIPALADGDLVLYETAAICLYLAEKHPEAGLLPVGGSAARAPTYKWLMWLTNTLQTALIMYFYPDRHVEPGNAAGAAEVKAVAERRIGGLLDQLDAQVAASGGPWFLGAHYSLLDAYVLTLCRWTRNFASPAARTRTHLGPYLQRVLDRPAVRRAFDAEGIQPPLV
jgi:glutathione S-transferase